VATMLNTPQGKGKQVGTLWSCRDVVCGVPICGVVASSSTRQ
jgi:hypothetical protein